MLKPFLLYMLFFIFFTITGFYIYVLYKYPEPKNIDHMLRYYPKDIMLQTGGILVTPNLRIQHFINFSNQKKEGVIRIGTFGDSFTYGSEVDKTETYPYQLQQLLNKAFPNKSVEVISFGKRGSNFQEQFFFWKKYTKKMGLDYVLFGPQGFWAIRDTTFSQKIRLD